MPRKTSHHIQVIRYNEFYQFVFWNCLPQNEKDKLGVSTQKDFSNKYKVDVATLSDWKKRNDFWKLVETEIQSWAKDLTPNVIRSLYKRAIRTDNAHPKDTELWLKYVEGWDIKKPTPDDAEIDAISLDDLNSIINWLPESEQKEFYQTFYRLIEKAKEIHAKQQIPVGKDESWLEPQNFI